MIERSAGTSTSELSQAHIRSGQVMTVRGPVPLDALGVTLMHEHLLIDAAAGGTGRAEPERLHLASAPVHAGIIGELRMDPFVNLDNCRLDDEQLAIAELLPFKAPGGATVVDPTCRGIGRDPAALQRISEATGLNIVMGAGYYLEGSHPPRSRR